MEKIKIPLLRINKTLEFDTEKIKSRKFLEKILELKENDFSFKHFGFCKDEPAFFVTIETYKNNDCQERVFKLFIEEINDDYYIQNREEVKTKKECFCDVTYLV